MSDVPESRILLHAHSHRYVLKEPSVRWTDERHGRQTLGQALSMGWLYE